MACGTDLLGPLGCCSIVALCGSTFGAWSCVTATDPTLFQSPFRAGIKIDAYQMEPLRKALRLPRVNLFIADDTGLGKTIEASLIARELLLRKRCRTIVVAAPPSMLEQWRAELEERFQVETVIDPDDLDHATGACERIAGAIDARFGTGAEVYAN